MIYRQTALITGSTFVNPLICNSQISTHGTVELIRGHAEQQNIGISQTAHS